MRGLNRGEERFRNVTDLERSVREATASLERSRALQEWWPEAFNRGDCHVRVERGELASYHVVAEQPGGFSKREPLVHVPRPVWKHAAETIVARERLSGGSALEKLIAGLAIEEAHA